MTTENFFNNNGILVNVKFREDCNSKLRIYSQECNFFSEVYDTIIELFEKIHSEAEFLPLYIDFYIDYSIDIIDLNGEVKPLVNQPFKELIKIGVNRSISVHSGDII